jgi:hypothetical protein
MTRTIARTVAPAKHHRFAPWLQVFPTEVATTPSTSLRECAS